VVVCVSFYVLTLVIYGVVVSVIVMILVWRAMCGIYIFVFRCGCLCVFVGWSRLNLFILYSGFLLD
jgi:hypothetical protein